MKKIMLVDDEADTRKLIRTLLMEEGYQVTTTKKGSECQAALNKAKFDLILIDFFMPRMNGRELLESIRKNPKTKNAKVAFLTMAKFGQQGIKTLKRLGVSDYIFKPIENEDFKKRIKKITG